MTTVRPCTGSLAAAIVVRGSCRAHWPGGTGFDDGLRDIGVSARDAPHEWGSLAPVSDLARLPHGQLVAFAMGQVARIDELTAANAGLVGDNQTLISMNETLTGKLSEAERKLVDVERRLVGVERELAKARHLLSRNSQNSSMPPSKDDQPGKTPPEPREPRRDGPVRAGTGQRQAARRGGGEPDVERQPR